MSDWLEEAKRLPLGRKTRLNHECGEGTRMVVSHNENGYSAYCFSCGPLGFHGHGHRTLEEIERVKALNAAAQKPLPPELPNDATNEIPAVALHWLFNAGIGVHRARSNGIQYSPSLGRVLLPVYDPSDSHLSYYQARAVHKGQSPKYTNPAQDKTALLYWKQPPTYIGGSRCVVITEDILSALRVGKHVQACSPLGTKLSEAQAYSIVEAAGGDTIFIWLDPDAAGISGAKAMYRKLSLLTERVQIITSSVDPKVLSDREIREHLNLAPATRYTYHA